MAQDQRQDIDLGISRLEYGDPARPQHAVLTLTTGKHYAGGVESSARVYWIGLHSRSHAFGLAGKGDFDMPRMKWERTTKATQRAIDRQHAEVFTAEVIEQLTQAAKEHYAEIPVKG
jgi:hypothetical protein